MSPRMMGFVGFLALDFALLVVRAIEVETGHLPTAELTLAFGGSVTATVGMLAALVKENGGMK